MTASPEVIVQALTQVEQGFAAFALARNSKVPVTTNGFKNATTNPDWVQTQLIAASAGNYGIIWPEDAPFKVMILDLDNGSDGRERPWQDRLLEQIDQIGPLPATKSTTTPSGGRHAFYRWPSGVSIPSGDALFGFTVRWPGRGYVVGPGSSINGIAYLPGPTEEIAELPAVWVAAAAASRQRERSGFISITGGRYELPNSIPSGQRYAVMRDYIASRYNSGLSPGELWNLVRTEVNPHFDHPKDEVTLRADFDRAIAKLPDRLGPPRVSTAVEAIPSGPLEDAPLIDFDSKPVEWVWSSWLPRGVVTIMDGNPGVSKSTLVADLVARITTGQAWPDGASAGPISRVLWVTTEDDPGRVLRPRLEAAGGNAELVRFVTSEVVFPTSAGGFLELLVRRAAEPDGLALAILDPLFSHIEAGVRTIADAEMRRGVMNPLNAAAEAANVAILVVRHFSKDTSASPINRGAGSLGGIVGAARAAWSVVPDPEDELGEAKVIGVSKLNYARTPPALRYQVVDRVPPGWIAGTVSGIEWLGEAKVSITQMMSETTGVADARDSLEQILANGAMTAVQVMALMKVRGFGRSAVQGAAKRLEVVKTKAGFQGSWTWELPKESKESKEAGDAPLDDSLPKSRGSIVSTSYDSLNSLGVEPSPLSGQAKESKESKEAEGAGGFPRARAREGVADRYDRLANGESA